MSSLMDCNYTLKQSIKKVFYKDFKIQLFEHLIEGMLFFILKKHEKRCFLTWKSFYFFINTEIILNNLKLSNHNYFILSILNPYLS